MMTRAPDEYGATLVGLDAGDVLSGRYRLEERCDAGGMGVVWRGTDELLDRTVAIKVLPTQLARDPRAVAKMKAEANRCLALSHPQIAPLRSFEQDEARGDLPYLVMAFVEGRSLNRLLVDHPEGVPVDRMVVWAKDLASALDHAHDRNVLHRDIKPANVMIDPSDRAILVDFGIAREMKDTVTRVTGNDSSGTLLYMSPQQLAGQSKATNDIYSLAATLYEALSGEPPFTTGDIRHQIVNTVPQPLTGVPAAVSAAIMSGLAKQADHRPPTATALVAAMEHGAPPTSGTARKSAGPAEPVQRGMWLVREANAGDVDAQFQLARCLQLGDGVIADAEAATEQFRKAGEAGHAEACYRLGTCYERGIGVKQSVESAAHWYEESARLVGSTEPFREGELTRRKLLDVLLETGCPEAYRVKGRGFCGGRLLSIAGGSSDWLGDDLDEAVRCLTIAAVREPMAHFDLGLLEVVGDDTDAAAAATHFEAWLDGWRPSEGETRRLHLMAARALYRHRGDPITDRVMRRLAMAGAELDDQDCEYIAAMCDVFVWGVHQTDDLKAKGIDALKALALDGHAEAAYRMAQHHGATNLGHEWFMMARDAAISQAPHLTLMNPTEFTLEVLNWIRVRAEEGCGWACVRVGLMAWNGVLGRRDLAEARTWLERALPTSPGVVAEAFEPEVSTQRRFPEIHSRQVAFWVAHVCLIDDEHRDTAAARAHLKEWSRVGWAHEEYATTTLSDDYVNLDLRCDPVLACDLLMAGDPGSDERLAADSVLNQGAWWDDDEVSVACLQRLADWYLDGTFEWGDRAQAATFLDRLRKKPARGASTHQTTATTRLRELGAEGIPVPAEFNTKEIRKQKRKRKRQGAIAKVTGEFDGSWGAALACLVFGPLWVAVLFWIGAWLIRLVGLAEPGLKTSFGIGFWVGVGLIVFFFIGMIVEGYGETD